MKINKHVIKKLFPCSDRYENYLKFYGNKELTKSQFMGRKNITQEDKLWVAFRLMPKENIQQAAADIAESVLSIYESKYPRDSRPKDAIMAARTGINAYASTPAYAAYAAYAAHNAAVHAANAAADNSRLAQEKLIRKIILKWWK